MKANFKEWVLTQETINGKVLPVSVSKGAEIINQFAEDFAKEDDKQKLIDFTNWLDEQYSLEDTRENSSFNERDWIDDINRYQKFKEDEQS